MQATYDAIIVGGGAAGIGVTIALQDAGLEHILVLERHQVGASFSAWPEETRFLTPSFPTNSMGMLDLNAISIGTSPAFSLQVEHPTGKDYASHLRQIAQILDLPIRENTTVLRITKIANEFVIDTESETLRAKHVVWAAGEFLYPNKKVFIGSELCRHTSTVHRYSDLEGDNFIVIGGYESGVDAAYHLASRGLDVHLFDRGCPWSADTSDPSITLSTYSQERMREPCFERHVTLHPYTLVRTVTEDEDTYEVTTGNDERFRTSVPPLLASGFLGSHWLLDGLFEKRPDGYPVLNDDDESTLVPGLFLCGPAVRHDDHVFCFIFKFRMRFAVVAKAIATSLGLPAESLEVYRQWGMYLDDLSCCGEECIC